MFENKIEFVGKTVKTSENTGKIVTLDGKTTIMDRTYYKIIDTKEQISDEEFEWLIKDYKRMKRILSDVGDYLLTVGKNNLED